MAIALLENGADVHTKNNEGSTPLQCASSDGHTLVALVENIADVHANTSSGETPLHRACVNGHAEVANGADVYAKNRDGDTPLTLLAVTATTCSDAAAEGHGVLYVTLREGANAHANTILAPTSAFNCTYETTFACVSCMGQSMTY